jgi:hypothetical protein
VREGGGAAWEQQQGRGAAWQGGRLYSCASWMHAARAPTHLQAVHGDLLALGGSDQAVDQHVMVALEALHLHGACNKVVVEGLGSKDCCGHSGGWEARLRGAEAAACVGACVGGESRAWEGV